MRKYKKVEDLKNDNDVLLVDNESVKICFHGLDIEFIVHRKEDGTININSGYNQMAIRPQSGNSIDILTKKIYL